MNEALSKRQKEGFVFALIAGVILHFLFDWSNQNVVVATFSAVNESIWEHIKLVFFPMFVFSLWEKKQVADYRERFWCIKLYGILLAVALIPVLYYTINGIFKEVPDWVNIAIFVVSVLSGFLLENYLFAKNDIACSYSKTAFIILCIIAIIFAVATFVTPKIPLFQDPVTGGYGIINT